MPSRKILQTYYELGGEIITLGSDAHTTEHLGDHMAYVRKQLKEIGYRNFCTFREREPIYHEL
ncbi:MAG: hypothetical protein ACK5ML_02265 [Lachnospiraceae bacterium]